jgi:squalene-hopene/tetraprenyl-beta-curcumene cyclase
MRLEVSDGVAESADGDNAESSKSESDRVGAVDALIRQAGAALRERQQPDGHWVFEFEADATIPAEYVLLWHFLGEPDAGKEAKIGRYLRRIQRDDGGWPLFEDGSADVSATVKAYYGLKLIGDDPEAPHMARARAHVLQRGGAARANVFTRITLALFEQVPWRAVPTMPAEIMLLPRWFPFHLEKVSYWSRTVIAPLAVLISLKPKARNPRGVDIRELFVTPPEQERDYIDNPTGSTIGSVFVGLDKAVKVIDSHMPGAVRQRAVDAAMDFIKPRLNGEDGLGGIFPAMANAVMAFDALGYPADDPDVATARAAVEKLLLDRGDEMYCQPCLSPVWDTSLAIHAMLEAGDAASRHAAKAACDWLVAREVTNVKGDWAIRRPALQPSGWAFQYRNDYYPDLDDSAVVVMALQRLDPEGYRNVIRRASRWIAGMQSGNGGWGAFDVDNTYHYLNHIPFADHGALLDPPTADVSARCLGMMLELGHDTDHPAVRKAIDFLLDEQEPDGSWYGRWGVNYVYGTWSVLNALNAANFQPDHPAMRRAAAFLLASQRADGGWGEDCATYWDECRGESLESTPSQTAWALMGLMAAGQVESEAVQRGVDYLVAQPLDGANWRERLWTGVGFPRVFYLKYHGYSSYFPLWALARYRNLMRSNDRRVRHAI